LRADLIAAYIGRIVAYMRRHGFDSVTAIRDPPSARCRSSTSIRDTCYGALRLLPKQGDRFPWRIHQNYLRDLFITLFSRLRDPALRFGRREGGA
jgi:hypothetical protein